MRLTAIAAAVSVLAACAGRSPAPVAVVQPIDRFMDCPAIQAEVLANNAKVQELASESGGKVAQNVAAGVAGLIHLASMVRDGFPGRDRQGTGGAH